MNERRDLAVSLDDLREFLYGRAAKISELLRGDVEIARLALAKHIDRLVLKPTSTPDGPLLEGSNKRPVVCFAGFREETEAVKMANSVDFALSASVWTGDDIQGRRVSLQLRCGTCAVNDVIRNIANPHAAFGGNGSSGYGRYHGEEGLRAFLRVRTVMTAHRLHDPEVHWFPFRSKRLPSSSY